MKYIFLYYYWTVFTLHSEVPRIGIANALSANALSVAIANKLTHKESKFISSLINI